VVIVLPAESLTATVTVELCPAVKVGTLVKASRFAPFRTLNVVLVALGNPVAAAVRRKLLPAVLTTKLEKVATPPDCVALLPEIVAFTESRAVIVCDGAVLSVAEKVAVPLESEPPARTACASLDVSWTVPE